MPSLPLNTVCTIICFSAVCDHVAGYSTIPGDNEDHNEDPLLGYAIDDKCDCDYDGGCKKSHQCKADKPFCSSCAKASCGGAMKRCVDGLDGSTCDNAGQCKNPDTPCINYECDSGYYVPWGPADYTAQYGRGYTSVRPCASTYPGAGAYTTDDQCDLDCRYEYGVFDRGIGGTQCNILDGGNCKTGMASSNYCNCFCQTDLGVEQEAVSLGKADMTIVSPTELALAIQYVKTPYHQDPNTWGVGELPFSTLVCTYNGDPRANMLVTMEQSEALDNGALIIHCGQCSACSSPWDVQVLYDSRTYITTETTLCAKDYAGLKNANKKETLKCMTDKGIPFTHNPSDRFGGQTGPTCYEAWLDDITCSANKCKRECFDRVIPDWLTIFTDEAGEQFSMEDECLKCNDEYCGPKFIQAAGASRRASSIISDIQRDPELICPVGWYVDCMACHTTCGSTASEECTKTCASQCNLPKALNVPGPPTTVQ